MNGYKCPVCAGKMELTNWMSRNRLIDADKALKMIENAENNNRPFPILKEVWTCQVCGATLLIPVEGE